MHPFRGTASLALLLALLSPAPAFPQQNPPPEAAEFARKILAALGPRPALRMSFENRSSLGVAEAAAIRRAIEQDLLSAGADLTAAAPPSTLRVTVSQTWRNPLLVGELQQGAAGQVILVALPASLSFADSAARSAASLALARRLVWRQSAPFLAFLEWESAVGHSSFLAVLEPGRLAVYRRAGSDWLPVSAASIRRQGPWPRDTRGLVWLEPSPSPHAPAAAAASLRAALPGLTCSLPLASPPPSGTLPLSCAPAPDSGTPFPLFEGAAVAATATLLPGRNVFAPVINRFGSALRLAPFFSAAFLEDDSGRQILLAAGLDGRSGLYDDSGALESSIPGWGSEIAGVESGCAASWQVLATGPGDWTQKDVLAAYRIVDRRAVPVAEPMDFPGPVLALETAPGGIGARAVVLDREASLYDAYDISLTCGR